MACVRDGKAYRISTQTCACPAKKNKNNVIESTDRIVTSLKPCLVSVVLT